MDEGQPNEAKELVDSYVVMEDEGDDCGILEDFESPMVLYDSNKQDSLNLENSHYVAGGVVEPTLGMEFASEEDAKNFYNAYAKQTGFSIRVNSYYRSKKDNSLISREFCCPKEGFRKDRREKQADSGEECKRRRARPITREGCKALMTVRKRDNGKWYVAKLEKNHNHELGECTKFECPGHYSSTCLLSNGSGPDRMMDYQSQSLAYSSTPCGNIPSNYFWTYYVLSLGDMRIPSYTLNF